MTLIRNLGNRRRAALALALVTGAWAVGTAATPTAADAAYSIGPLVLNEGSANQIQVPSLLSFSFGIASGGSSKGWGAGGHAPKSTSEMTVTKTLDAASPALLQAASSGKHYKTAGLTLQKSDSTFEAICLTDVFVLSAQAQSAHESDEQPKEQISFVYDKLAIKYGATAVSPPCGQPPPIESTLLGVQRHGSSVLARVDCLSAHCRGVLTLSLPPAACPGGGPACAFTGGVRVGLNGNGKVHFNGDGSATLNGGTRVGLIGVGKFSMGDGSVKIIRLGVPAPLRKWLNGHQHGVLGAIIVVRGLGTALVQRDELDPPAKLPPGAPSDSVEPPPGSGPVDIPQSLSLASCTGTHPVGTPATVVVVSGSLAPARSGAKVTLTYTPTSGPPPLPSPVVDTVTSDATGGFSENFNRQQGGLPYGWSVTASIPEGGGYSVAQSAACSIPVP